jgi:putative flavoprotein involved in K+ transport
MSATATHNREVVVIGGGQAGLAIGHHLAEQGRRFTILEAAGKPAILESCVMRAERLRQVPLHS